MSAMKTCVIQPRYSYNHEETDACFRELLAMLDQCDESMDLIVLPEYSDAPAGQPDKAHYDETVSRNGEILLARAKATARRCSALVFVNAAYKSELGYRNTTYAIDRSGEIAGHYFKAHPAPSEVRNGAGGIGLDVAYSYEYAEPYILELEGIRFGFLTCYDFYFYEAYAALARRNPDIIIGCSLQRTDSHHTLSTIHSFLTYNTNAYLVRASVSLGEDSPLCGCSTICGPDGRILVDMKSRVGMGIATIDPEKKFYKAAGFGGAQKAHYEYIEEGRRPWLYRNGGSAIVPYDDRMPYPRLCAHRGFSTAAPENTLPAFGAAIALGAQEIEFDLWETADGVIVSCHDDRLERVSNGTGLIYDHPYAELLELDFGSHFSDAFKGLKIVTFEEILRKFSGHCIMNVHVKTRDALCEFSEATLHRIAALIYKYDAQRHVYFMSGNDNFLAMAQRLYPDIPRCCGAKYIPGTPDPWSETWNMVDRALRYACRKIQLFKPYFNQEMIDRAHANGIICNVFYADDPEEARRYRDMGIDTILTNDYLLIHNTLNI